MDLLVENGHRQMKLARWATLCSLLFLAACTMDKAEDPDAICTHECMKTLLGRLVPLFSRGLGQSDVDRVMLGVADLGAGHVRVFEFNDVQFLGVNRRSLSLDFTRTDDGRLALRIGTPGDLAFGRAIATEVKRLAGETGCNRK